MKVWIDTRFFDVVSKSGIGKAIEHQKRALYYQQNVTLVDGLKEDYDVVHFNTIFPTTILSAWKAKRQKKVVVIHAHSTMEDFKNSFIGSNLIAPLFKWWIKRCYNCGDLIITPTEYSKQLLQSYGIKKDIFVVSNGIDLSFFKKQENIEKKGKQIISVGHYIERKGLLDFVELAKRMPEKQFYWYGYTSEALQTPQIKAALETKVANVHFPGYVDKNRLKQIYQEADVFLFMTYEETEGIVLLEAMAMHLPVVVRDIPIYETMFTDGVDVYKFTDLDSCQQKVNQAILQEENVIQAAYNQAKERDIDKIGEQLYTIYQHALSKKAHKS